MSKRKRSSQRNRFEDKPIDWLPFDSRLIPFFSFPHVRGMARIFLIVEMLLCFLVVMGTMVLVLLKAFA